MGLRGDVNDCKNTPPDVRQRLTEMFEKKKSAAAHLEEINEDDEEQEEVQEIYNIRAGRPTAEGAAPSGKRGKTAKGPINLHYAKKQTSINDACDKEARSKTIQFIARFFYKCGIPFNVVRDKSFKAMLDAVGYYGPNLKAPSYHEMRVPLLKKELVITQKMLRPHMEERVKSGCSIMSDAWTDRKNRTLINFMVNCPLGTMFNKSVDASGYVKSGQKLYELLDSFVTEVGENNVVQVITDNGSNYVSAGRFLEARRKHLFWTPCAAHCIDLMLEDIGKMPTIKRACQRGVSLVSFIYNHTMALNVMRQFTNKTELVRAGITRFATHFLTLQRLHKQKANLRRMFTSEEWTETKASKDPKGKKATSVVLMPSFWNDVLYSLKAMAPLVQVLRLVDNEKKPAMGYIYEAMDRAKEAIMVSFNGNENKYKDIWAIVDKRWECQLHHPLHATGHFLNPEFLYGNPDVDQNSEINLGLLKCIERLSCSEEEEDKATNELAIYRRSEGCFNLPAAIRNRTTMAPAEWWKTYGHHVPSLQKIAIRVLSFTCSSSGCERNWSCFEQASKCAMQRIGTAEEDAYRRDLTINSLFYNINTDSVEDFTKRGISHLKSGKIVTPLPPKATFLDDPLRVLRAIRFGARFEFALDEDLKKAAACDEVKDALAAKISRERIGTEVDLMISGNQPVRATTYICDLTIFWIVFSLPPEFEPAISDGCERLCISYLDIAWNLIYSLGMSTFTDEQRRLTLYAALFLPLRNTIYKEKKAKKVPVVNYIIRESLKRKAKDAEMVLDLHRASHKFLSLIPCLASDEEVQIVGLDWMTELTDVPVSSRVRVLTGFLLREVRDFWRVALLISTILHPIDINDTEDESSLLSKRRDLFNTVENSVIKLGLDKVWDVKQLINGKDVMNVLQLKGGPLVKESLDKAMAWQLAHPSGTAEECIDWLKETNSKRVKLE